MKWRVAAVAVSVAVSALLGGQCLLAAAPAGRTWHVSPAELPGIDKAVQLRSISAAAERVEAGDTVIIHGGTYREHVVVTKSGTAERPITFAAAPGEYVVLTGADRIEKWERIAPGSPIFRTPWPYDFIPINDSHTHPDDDYHAVIGRAEQVFVAGYQLHQVLSRELMSRGTFYVDLKAKQLYLWGYGNDDFTDPAADLPEVSARDTIWESKGAHLHLRGLRFRYCANMAQHGAATFSGDYGVVEDCIFERTNAAGVQFEGEHITVRRCTFQDNGQLGFGGYRCHDLLLTGCTVRNNNTKGFSRGWEAGGDKVTMARGVVIEHSLFLDNRGTGIWFDGGNEDTTIRNCLIAGNEEAGIFYEISYGLRAHDNVIIGNGFLQESGGWGGQGGVSISSSPGCVIERNLIIGNKEGFDFREQDRMAGNIDGTDSPVWVHDEIIRHNTIAYNRDAQTWGWFDIEDERYWPAAMKKPGYTPKPPGPDAELSLEVLAQLAKLSLEDLKITFEDNVYYAAPGQPLFNWGCDWYRSGKYAALDDVRRELHLENGSVTADPGFADLLTLDLRVAANSVVLSKGCYPKGDVPGVTLGIIRQ